MSFISEVRSLFHHDPPPVVSAETERVARAISVSLYGDDGCWDDLVGASAAAIRAMDA